MKVMSGRALVRQIQWRQAAAASVLMLLFLTCCLWPVAALAGGGGGGGSDAGKAMSAMAGGGPDPDATSSDRLEADLKNAFRRPEMPSEEDLQEFERKMMGMSSEKYGTLRKKYDQRGGFGGTGQSFQKWLNAEYSRAYWNKRAGEQQGIEAQVQLATIYHRNVEKTLVAADKAGEVTQFTLSFVPGVGTATGISLDAARSLANTYKANMDAGMSQTEAWGKAVKSGLASGLISASLSKVGAGKLTGANKNVKNAFRYGSVGGSQAMKAEAMRRGVKKLGRGWAAITVDESAKQLFNEQSDKALGTQPSPDVTPSQSWR